MQTLYRHLFQLFALILLTSYSTFAIAIDCKKAKSEIEKLICKPGNFHRINDFIMLDNKFNTLYNKIIAGLDGEKKEEFKKSIHDMIKIRDGCINVYGLSIKSRNGYRNRESDFHQFRCLETFYKSIINSMTDLETFKIPSADEYMDIFFGIRTHIDYTEDIQDKPGSYVISEEICDIDEKFLFFKNHPFVIYHDVHSFNDSYYAHPFVYHNIFYYTFDKNNKNIEFVGYVPKDKLQYPISKITEINGSLYIPHNESVASIFDIAGLCNKDACIYDSIYPKCKPDCLLHFKDLDGISDSLFAFTEDYLTSYCNESEGPYSEPKPLQDYQKDYQKCLLSIIKKYSEKKINLELVDQYSTEEKTVKYIVIKSSNVQAIREIINSRCNQYVKDVDRSA